MSVLTKQERSYVVDSWSLVTPNLQTHGSQFIIMLFSDEPSLQQKHFSSIDVNDISRIQSHGLKVMKGIDGMVNAIYEENDELLVEKILYVARGHYRRGIRSRVEFEVVCNTLEKYLTANLGDNLSPEAAKAWRKLLNTLLDVILAEHRKIHLAEK